jgi:hypothetical protein
MKALRTILIATFFIAVIFPGCKDVIYENDLRNVPVYLSYTELRSAVKKNSSRELINPGKIYFKDGYIFINEELKGIHVIDNRDPRNPENVAFIEIPGNIDMAVKNDILYADSYIDLVSIDISDLSNPHEVDRVTNVFPYTIPQIKDGNYLIAEIDEDKGVVIDWEIDYARMKVERQSYPIYRNGRYGNEFNSIDKAYFNLSASSSTSQSIGGYTSTNAQGSSFGIGGSMARFGLNGDFLYTVDAEKFHIFNVGNDKSIVLENEKKQDWILKPCSFTMVTFF